MTTEDLEIHKLSADREPSRLAAHPPGGRAQENWGTLPRSKPLRPGTGRGPAEAGTDNFGMDRLAHDRADRARTEPRPS